MRDNMTPEEALKLIEPIPAENFITFKYTDGESKCCVMGHLNRLTSENPNDFSFENCAVPFSSFKTLRDSMKKLGNSPTFLAEVNNRDWPIKKYPQPIIKDRVIACLKDMIAAEC